MANETTEPRFQTFPVLAGAYKGSSDARAMLTHLADITVDSETALCKRVKPSMLCDYNSEGYTNRPTCEVCGKKWDRLVAGK